MPGKSRSLNLSDNVRTHPASVRLGNVDESKNYFVAVMPVSYKDVAMSLVSDTATSSSDTTNNWSFQLANLTSGTTLLTTALNTGTTEMTADTAYALSPDKNLTGSAGDVMELQVTENGSPTSLASAEVGATLSYKTTS